MQKSPLYCFESANTYKTFRFDKPCNTSSGKVSKRLYPRSLERKHNLLLLLNKFFRTRPLRKLDKLLNQKTASFLLCIKRHNNKLQFYKFVIESRLKRVHVLNTLIIFIANHTILFMKFVFRTFAAIAGLR